MHICPSCHRHVRETTCPFCSTAFEPGARPAAITHPIRLGRGRAAIAAGVLAVAGGAASVHAAGDDGRAAVSAYGIPMNIPPVDPSRSDAGGAHHADAGHSADAGHTHPDAGVDAGHAVDAGHGADAGHRPPHAHTPAREPGGVEPPYGIPPEQLRH